MPTAIITARSGSKRIKNKNLKLINGKPMLYWVIQILKLSKIFDDIVVSTDSQKIANIAKKTGASIPYLRPKKLSGDKVPDEDVMQYVVKKLNNNNKYICLVYPTAILMHISDIKKGYKKLLSNQYNYIFTATKHKKSVIRSFIFKKNQVKQIIPESYNTRTQDLPDTYYDSGQFYWGRRECWLKKNNRFNLKSTIVSIPNYRSIDIDYPNDLKLAKKKFNLYKEKKLDLIK